MSDLFLTGQHEALKIQIAQFLNDRSARSETFSRVHGCVDLGIFQEAIFVTEESAGNVLGFL